MGAFSERENAPLFVPYLCVQILYLVFGFFLRNIRI